ncbi:MAG: hypothetical protein UX53_C0022G0005 [Candidatus Azambacteria bacterium GW2011_GWB2_46_37]|uniref:Uncharacterized protein n=3 Tax=Candidatus Azamiibacteriota TaxID=1752741 RepID=A0A0G1QCL5_9BACT|nr:MAG: hypothetical protein UX51_C0017G0010 [Candidatus Azambacteria bacterium GW2011_GWF2_46_32]KKU38878.1 MAG: hypothetical protein UX53_C0022G0005 [Candidatus Azambacteria bacterium GW2011_GWB2_46_37]KKU42766.1 MAG: hypothetical protein UX56_C0007G0015 [Candidatus Azambacteria bacterium GW2011_GWD2_46_48]HAQ05878.1 hypothetical protein [Candidatus Azambacteria bacterium]HCB36014.1 hypothetical protein [Candidatus Azambacteria bacterium]
MEKFSGAIIYLVVFIVIIPLIIGLFKFHDRTGLKWYKFGSAKFKGFFVLLGILFVVSILLTFLFEIF